MKSGGVQLAILFTSNAIKKNFFIDKTTFAGLGSYNIIYTTVKMNTIIEPLSNNIRLLFLIKLKCVLSRHTIIYIYVYGIVPVMEIVEIMVN